MKLYTDPGNIQSCKIILAADSAKLAIQLQEVKQNDSVPGESRPPVLVLPDGTPIHSANSAARYVIKKGGQAAGQEESDVDGWLEWEATQLYPLVCHSVAGKFAQKMDDKQLSLLKAELTQLETQLSNASFILGDAATVVDLCIWPTIYILLYDNSPLKVLKADYPNISRWFDQQLTAFQQAVSAVTKGNKDAVKKWLLSGSLPPAVTMTTGKKTTPSTSSEAAPSETEEKAVTAEERDAARDSWLNGRSRIAPPRPTTHPVLPKEGEENILITSALPYVNNVPHLGNIIGCVLSADVFARFCRLRNKNTLYICGTDEYGTATETKAVEEGVTPQQICDKYHVIHKDIYDWFNIKFDYFGRTTTQQQTKIAQDLFWRLHENNFILSDSVEQQQCQKCDRFLADRFVEGTCPLCGYEDARGDQCDACGRLINAIELKNPRCKICSNTPIVRSSEHLFMDLPKIEPLLVEYLDREFQRGYFSSNAKNITRTWIRDGLKPRCISRDLKWGTPVPLEGYENKVFYVWYDAPIGYISITANYTSDWKLWWNNQDNVELYNFMAKDNVPFHSVIFPCTLLGAKQDWTIVKHLSATEYLNYEDGKFSKSRGVGVFGNNARDTGIPADTFRFYLLYIRPESNDTTFSWDDMVLKCNSDLLNNLGNFINRSLMFVKNNFGGVIPEMTLREDDLDLLAQVNRELKTYIDLLTKVRLRDGIRVILNISRYGNQFIQANQPWLLVKGSVEEKARAGTINGLSANIVCLIASMLNPYMPEVSDIIRGQLNAPAESSIIPSEFTCFLPPGHKIGEPKPLFQKIEAKLAEELRKKYAGKQDDKPKQPVKAKPAGGPAINGPAAGPAGPASQEEIDRLTAAVTEQGDAVRKLKTEIAEKSKVDAAVAKLLDLKRQLTIAQGKNPDEAAGSGGKKKKGKK